MTSNKAIIFLFQFHNEILQELQRSLIIQLWIEKAYNGFGAKKLITALFQRKYGRFESEILGYHRKRV